MERVVLIDGTALIYRAFYAIPSSFSTRYGTPTNATYGFALMFRKILSGKKPKFGAVVFDAPGKTFRNERFPQYKAQRPPMAGEMRVQIPWIHRIVEAHDFPLLSVPGYEADDVIGTLSREALEAGHEVHIVSGDKDFAQLIGPHVRMLDTMRDISYDPELVRKKWGVTPERFVDHLALMGDKVDNIPGVPGIGQKGSAKLLNEYGSLEGIYENIDVLKGKQRENLINYRSDAFLSRELATIDCCTPLRETLDDLILTPVDEAQVNELYRELEFNSLIEGDDETEAAVAAGQEIEIAASACGLEAWLAMHDGLLSVVVMIEGGHMHGPLAGVAFGTPDSEAIYAPLVASTGALGADASRTIAEVLADPERPKVFHGYRDDRVALMRHGFETVEGVVGDTELGSFLIDPAALRTHDLDRVVKQFLQRTVRPIKTVIGAGKAQQALAEVDPTTLGGWAGERAIAIAELWPEIRQQLGEELQIENLDRLCLPMAETLARMQYVGVRVDPEVLSRLQYEFAERRAEVQTRIYEHAGREFNIGSPKQLGGVLFDEMGIPIIKRTKTGYSTNAEVLQRLAPKYAIARDVLEWRSLDKLINTYTEVLQRSIHPETGRIHATFQQTSGVSGRLITTDPDLQRTPIRTEDGKRIREAFVPRDGWVFLSADWSQIELRVLAHFSKDPMLVHAFRECIDLHRQTASRIFDVGPDDVTPDQRNVGKTVNFATIYGQGATALGQQLGVSRSEAKAMIDRYFSVYSGVREWLDRTIAAATETGSVTTILGRRRYIQELKSNNWRDKGYGERIAANTPIQGSAADICKTAMMQIHRRFDAAGLEAAMMVQVHDELLFECPPAELDQVVALVRECMETCISLEVPLVVDIGHGESWAAAH
jgi:DNA polymerase-1